MARKKRWEEHEIVDGIGVIKLSSWRYFFDFVYQEMLDYETYIWRGHRCEDWRLESTLDRLLQKAKIAEYKKLLIFDAHLEKFKYAIRGRRGSNPIKIETENDWWALGQHHGLATPLLDWTASPFVAAYFAFIGTGERQTKHRAIIALSKPSVEHKATKLLQSEKKDREQKMEGKEGKKISLLEKALLARPVRKQVEFIRPLSDENQRLVNQDGLFTRAPFGKTLEDWVKKNFNGQTKHYTIMKILVPNIDRNECLRTLNRMNINHLTLFPDIYGASKFCNLFGEIEKY